MEKENKSKSSLVRFNLERELDAEAWKLLQGVDKKKFKSVNEYLLNAIVTYGKIQKRELLTEEEIREAMKVTTQDMVKELLEQYNKQIVENFKGLVDSGAVDRYLFDYAIRNMELY